MEQCSQPEGDVVSVDVPRVRVKALGLYEGPHLLGHLSQLGDVSTWEQELIKFWTNIIKAVLMRKQEAGDTQSLP